MQFLAEDVGQEFEEEVKKEHAEGAIYDYVDGVQRARVLLARHVMRY